MPNLSIPDVPDDVHAVLVSRAKLEGLSLDRYVAGLLAELAGRPSRADLLERIGRRSGGVVGFGQAAEDLTDARPRD